MVLKLLRMFLKIMLLAYTKKDFRNKQECSIFYSWHKISPTGLGAFPTERKKLHELRLYRYAENIAMLRTATKAAIYSNHPPQNIAMIRIALVLSSCVFIARTIKNIAMFW